jgi:ribosomal protein S24E
MKIQKDIKNRLMKRRELVLVIESDSNPGFAGVSKVLSEEFKTPEDQILVENVKGRFGSNTFLVKASIYDSKELMEEAKKRMIKVKKEIAPAA